MKRNNRMLFAVLITALAVMFSPLVNPVQAAGPFTVNTTADTHDAAPGNGACADAGGYCSLRAAIEEANASATPTTINLPPETYNLTLGALEAAANGNRTITINGTNPDSTIIHQTNAAHRVMAIDYYMGGNTNVTLSGVTLSGGGDAGDHFGGAGILAGSGYAPSDRLTLSNCRIENNLVSPISIDQLGGAVRMDGGILTVTNCTFTNNSSGSASGGAIAFVSPEVAAPGTVAISASTFVNNTVANNTPSGPIGGGAIYINNAAATISNSTFTANQATSLAAGGAHGGALYFNTGTLTIDHSTFTGNAASGTFGRGGVIYLDSGTLSLTYSRLFGNYAASGGSGLFNHALNGAVTTATNNWWGCNAGPAATGCDQAVTNNGALTVSPWIVLRNTASPNVLHPGGTATLTASLLQNSSGQALTTGDISVLLAKPLAWTNVINGMLTNQQTAIGSNGQATATFTAGAPLATGGASAQFDNAVVSAQVTVIAEADLAVTKTGPATAVTGNTITYTVTLSNNGPDAAPYATLTDALPAGLTFVSQRQTGGPTFTLNNTGNTINNSIASLAAGTTASFEITATLAADATPGSTLSNTATSSLSIADPVPANNSATASSTVYVAPAITSGNAASFTLGAAGSFTVTATGYPIPAISQSGSLPTGVTFNDNGDGTATLSGTPASGTAGGFPLTLTASNASGIDASQSFNLTVQVAATAVSVSSSLNPSSSGQSVTFTASVTSPAGTPDGVVQFSVDGSGFGAPIPLNSGTAALTTAALSAGMHNIGASYSGAADFAPSSAAPIIQTITPVADLSVNKSGPTFVLPGDTLIYTVTVSNAGPDAALNTVLSDVLPDGLTLVSQIQTGGPFFTLTSTDTIINNSIAALPADATASFEITAMVDAAAVTGSTISNTATVASDTADLNPANNGATAATTVYTAAVITSANEANFTVGAPGSFTVTATGDPTPAISLSGALPDGVTFSDNGDGTATLSGTPAPGTAGSYALTITAGNGAGVDASQNFTLTVLRTATAVSVTATPNPSVFGQMVTLTATVTSTEGMPTGVVQFTLDGGNLGAPVALADGIATFAVTSLTTGAHTVGAAYAGDANFAPASGTLTGGQEVAQADTTTTLTATLGGSLFLPELLLEVVVAPVAPGAGVPTGTVTFTDGLTMSSEVALDATGRASVVVPGFAPGVYTWTASYGGDTNFTASDHAVALSVPFVVALPMISR